MYLSRSEGGRGLPGVEGTMEKEGHLKGHLRDSEESLIIAAQRDENIEDGEALYEYKRKTDEWKIHTVDIETT